MRTNKLTVMEKLCFCLAAVALMCASALVIVGCGGNNGNNGGGGADMAQTCSMNPMTHVEIINACTDSQSVDIQPFFPTSAPNGTLPSLP
jgi:hypothetical protein